MPSTPPARPKASARHPRLAVVNDVARSVEKVEFPLQTPGAQAARELSEQVLTQIRLRLVPRLKEEEAPAVVVLGGSTGVGKSTLVNSVLGEVVTEAGILRPTTRQPTVAVHPDDLFLIEGRPLTEIATVVTHEAVPAGITLLDAPDLNSVDARNRSLANQLLESADLWVFVTSASRYGDAVPWQMLQEASERGITTAVVLNRVPEHVLAPVRRDLMNRLNEIGMGSAPFLVIGDAGPLESFLPPERVRELDAWLRLVADRHRSSGVVRRTTRGVWAGLREQVLALAESADVQERAAEQLRTVAQEATSGPAEAVREALAQGRAGSGAPTTRWLALASRGGALAGLQEGRRLGRGLFGRGLQSRDAAAAGLAGETLAALRLVIADHLRRAASALTDAWSDPELGAGELLSSVPLPPADQVARRVTSQWAEAVIELAPGETPALSRRGLAALIQAGAAGVAGAAEVADRLVPGAVARARQMLLDYAEKTVREVSAEHLAVLEDLPIRPGTSLRLRASELKEHS